ncbi:DHA2 family efflux MFS transporter permease subunit [Streptomyces platensis]|uniref:DHA2 family efflux MFS transporter permease subunit n=1 Tax=Streptomyces platensis TaxID=58346 RepID=UPI001F3E2FD0|nr:DHA2 family efflux MFS transporter permease subunit [Streptomyces platensis]
MSVGTERDANPRNGTNRRPAKSAATPGLLLLLACGAMFLVILDATIVSVALPAIGSELGFGTAELGWVVNAYTLTFAGFLLLGGRLADLYGTRLLLVTGLVVFTLANLWSGLAVDPAQLVTARAVQGIGGALLMPATLTVVHQAYGDPVRRARALGLWSMVGAVGAAAGTVLGGVLTDVFGWRWVFGIKVPIGVAVAVAGWLVLPRRTATESDRARRRIDVIGALLVTAGLAALVHGVVTLRATGTREAAIAGLAAAVTLLVLFLVHQGRWARDPLVPLRIFTNRSVSSANVVVFGLGVAYLASPVLLALYLQQVLHYSPTRAGFGFLPSAFAVMIGAQLAGRLTPRWGPRRTAAVGTAVSAAGFLWLSGIGAHSAFLMDIALPSLVFGLGAGVAFTPITVAATGGIDPSMTGLASGLLNTTRQVATALGIAVLTTLAEARGGAPGYALAFMVSAVLTLLASLAAAVWMPPRAAPRRSSAA